MDSSRNGQNLWKPSHHSGGSSRPPFSQRRHPYRLPNQGSRWNSGRGGFGAPRFRPQHHTGSARQNQCPSYMSRDAYQFYQKQLDETFGFIDPVNAAPKRSVTWADAVPVGCLENALRPIDYDVMKQRKEAQFKTDTDEISSEAIRNYENRHLSESRSNAQIWPDQSSSVRSNLPLSSPPTPGIGEWGSDPDRRSSRLSARECTPGVAGWGGSDNDARQSKSSSVRQYTPNYAGWGTSLDVEPAPSPSGWDDMPSPAPTENLFSSGWNSVPPLSAVTAPTPRNGGRAPAPSHRMFCERQANPLGELKREILQKQSAPQITPYLHKTKGDLTEALSSWSSSRLADDSRKENSGDGSMTQIAAEEPVSENLVVLFIQPEVTTSLSKYFATYLSLDRTFLLSLITRCFFGWDSVQENLRVTVNWQHFGHYVESNRAAFRSPVIPLLNSDLLIPGSDDLRNFLRVFTSVTDSAEPAKREQNRRQVVLSVSRCSSFQLFLMQSPYNTNKTNEACQKHEEAMKRANLEDRPRGQDRRLSPYDPLSCRACVVGTGNLGTKPDAFGYCSQREWRKVGSSGSFHLCPEHTADIESGWICPDCLETEVSAECGVREDTTICRGRNRREFHLFHLECARDSVCPHCGSEDTTCWTPLMDCDFDEFHRHKKSIRGTEKDLRKIFDTERVELAPGIVDVASDCGDAVNRAIALRPRLSLDPRPFKLSGEIQELKDKKGKKSLEDMRKISLAERMRVPIWTRKIPFYPLTRAAGGGDCSWYEEPKVVRSRRDSDDVIRRGLIMDKYKYSLMTIAPADEACVCREVCVPPCPCVSWQRPDFRYTEDQRLMLGMNAKTEWTRECSELCSCDRRLCGNRATQLPSKVSIRKKERRNGEVVACLAQSVSVGTFVCRLGGRLVEENSNVSDKKLFFLPRFGIWPDPALGVAVRMDRHLTRHFISSAARETASLIPVLVMDGSPRMPDGSARQIGFPGVAFFAARNLPAGTELSYSGDFRDVHVYQPPLTSRRDIDTTSQSDVIYKRPNARRFQP